MPAGVNRTPFLVVVVVRFIFLNVAYTKGGCEVLSAVRGKFDLDSGIGVVDAGGAV